MPAHVEPLVSVVIPCYKQAHFLGDSIESVLRQTVQNFEIVAVDNASPDDASEVAARYDGVRCIRLERNLGPSGGRNAGLRESKGRYLVFLDSDDRLLPHALETGLEQLSDRPECAFVWGHSRHITADGSPIPRPPKPDIAGDYYRELLRTNYIRTPAEIMYRRAVLDDLRGFNVSLPGGEDYELNLRITRSFPVFCHGITVAEYREHSTNAMLNTGLVLRDVLRVLRMQRDYVKEHKEFEDAYAAGMREWRQFLGARLSNEVWSQLRKRERLKEALRNLRLLMQHYPFGFARYTSAKLFRAVAKS